LGEPNAAAPKINSHVHGPFTVIERGQPGSKDVRWLQAHSSEKK
jgi:hypothetical protein